MNWNWLKRNFKSLRFRFFSWRFGRDLKKHGVPNRVIGNVFLSIAGAYPYEKVKEELAQYDVQI